MNNTFTYSPRWGQLSSFALLWALFGYYLIKNLYQWRVERLGASISVFLIIPIFYHISTWSRPTFTVGLEFLWVRYFPLRPRPYRWSDVTHIQAVRVTRARKGRSVLPPLRFQVGLSDPPRVAVWFDEEIRRLADLLAFIDKKHVEYGFPLHYYVNDSDNTRVPVPKPLPRGPVIDSLSSLTTEPPTGQRRAPGV